VYALYSAFLRDLDARLDGQDWLTCWLATPDTRLFAAWIGHRHPVLMQMGDSLNERLLNGFRQLLPKHKRVVIMSTDSPHIPTTWIAEAFALLDRHDVVLGPCDDGGYYLVALKEPHDIFTGIAMSTPLVMRQTLALAEAQSLAVAHLPSTFDVDDHDGLASLRVWLGTHDTSLPRTRAVLTHGIPKPPPLLYHVVGCYVAASQDELQREVALFPPPPGAQNTSPCGTTGSRLCRIARAVTTGVRAALGVPVSELAVYGASLVTTPPAVGTATTGQMMDDFANILHEVTMLATLASDASAPHLAHVFEQPAPTSDTGGAPRTIDQDILLLAVYVLTNPSVEQQNDRRTCHAATGTGLSGDERGTPNVLRGVWEEAASRLTFYRTLGLDVDQLLLTVRSEDDATARQ